MTIHKPYKPAPTAAFQLRKAVSEGWAYEIFVDEYGDRFNDALLALVACFDGLLTEEQAQKEIFSLLKESAVEYFEDQIPEDEYNSAIMPGFLFKRQAS